jgi:hypothetical protein
MKPLSRLLVAFVLAAATLRADLASAQDDRHPARIGRRAVLAPAREIALARSAAPAAVSDSSAIWLFSDSGYVQVRQGTNGAACYVARSYPAALEPHCFDAEGAATIMRIHMRQVEVLHRGGSLEEMDRVVGAEIATGKLRLPTRPAMSYMMSAAQELFSDGRAVGSWQPHMMIFFPYLAPAALYRGAPDMRAGLITGAGTALSSMLVAAPAFVQVREGIP